jgi:diguanylate cyclase (GGDEF)-like protein/PAS domain S-box-containing protein
VTVAAQPEVLTLVDGSPDALLAVSPSGRVLYATAALQRDFGLAPASVADTPIADLVHPADRDRVVEIVRDAAAAPTDRPPRTTVARFGGGERWRPAVARLGRADLPGGGVAVVSLAPVAPSSSEPAVLEVAADGAVVLPSELAEALGTSPSARPAIADLVHPEDLPAVLALLDQDEAVPEPGFGVRLAAAGGQWRPVTLTKVDGDARLAVRVEPATAPAGTTQALPVGVLVLDADLAAVYRNSRAAELVGAGPASSWLAAVDEHDRDQVAATLRSAATTGRSVTARACLAAAGRVVELRAAPLPVPGRGDLLACVADEVSDVVRAEDEAARLTAIVEASSDLIATSGPDGRLRWVNPAFRLFLSAIADDPLGLDMAELYAPWAQERWEEEALPRLDQRGLWAGEMALRPIGTAEVPVSQVSVAHRDARGQLAFCSHVLRDLTARKVHEAGLAHQATHDPLTDLPNRILLMDRLHTALARARRAGGVVALLFCDLDDFKAVNDRYGHDAGDRLLLAIADRLVAVLREPDTVARLGGDEFVMLCEGLRSAGEADLIADRVTDALSEPVALGEVIVDPSASVGVAVTVDGDAEAEVLLRHADRAMYRVKHRKGR